MPATTPAEKPGNGQIPIVDISDLLKDGGPNQWGHVARSIAEACRDSGFFYIKNHGVDEQLVENVVKVWRDFVTLPESEKCKIHLEGASNFRGYCKFQGETTGYYSGDGRASQVLDWREAYYKGSTIPDGHSLKEKFPALTQSNKWPNEPVGFKDTVEKYCNVLAKLSFKIMSCLAMGLGLKHDAFEPWFTPYPMCQLGMFYYPPHNEESGPKEFSLGEHTDYGIMTILLQDDAGGLERRCEDSGQWVPVPHIPGTFVINLGDMLEMSSNGAYKATEHRVRKSEGGEDRVSMAFFFEPCADAVVDFIPIERPLIALKKRIPNANIKMPMVYGNYLQSKFHDTFSTAEKISSLES